MSCNMSVILKGKMVMLPESGFQTKERSSFQTSATHTLIFRVIIQHLYATPELSSNVSTTKCILMIKESALDGAVYFCNLSLITNKKCIQLNNKRNITSLLVFSNFSVMEATGVSALQLLEPKVGVRLLHGFVSPINCFWSIMLSCHAPESVLVAVTVYMICRAYWNFAFEEFPLLNSVVAKNTSSVVSRSSATRTSDNNSPH
ncbi:hypothetical protein PHYBLDRAFT_65262 [Phycomyces blakesleeanus NRRL 1555(-)]|uniref:Uncharacterized protein n=1 Tax=Phycomyces blakesleeanus (strain ATCC 8743b / DSM 1359 / FGSC 10004 / NBRC 33097 / NRRL 1555) TaxID=763407 RepID=A0A167MH13_PHYB8|nr:hypothetical protein PHYBLDRAFT_65262 [Phycomyces blakesleeanus NRRL 1555(-)]OAD72816.1 hypothetical protein PHYBLDRAFT_65262 [Phycomyces blakesleeanus NRRL 1555(-)]|eukprot:XP_018290856.1 hypothetical protein PHYBLDRAFT_65262 [Phycomyces blakesleeanus NRRL 1555(-)]